MAEPQLDVLFVTAVPESPRLRSTQVMAVNTRVLPWKPSVPPWPPGWVLLTEGERIPIGSVYLRDDHASLTVPAVEASLDLEHGVIRRAEGTWGSHGPDPRQLASLQEDTR